MRALAREVVGRDEELAVVRDFLAAVDRLPSALLIEGEAGIGKTTLWSAGIAVAAEHGQEERPAREAQPGERSQGPPGKADRARANQEEECERLEDHAVASRRERHADE